MQASNKRTRIDYTRTYGPAALGGRLRRLAEKIDEDAARIYAELGVSFEQRWLGVMEHLAEHGPASVTALADALGISHPSVSQTRRSLEAAGLIESRAHHRDARSRTLDLSPAGRRLYERLQPVWGVFNEIAETLNAEAGNVVAALDRLDQALKKQSLHDRIRQRLPGDALPTLTRRGAPQGTVIRRRGGHKAG
jgi:DNA-binding MarR family transcriptional regulator